MGHYEAMEEADLTKNGYNYVRELKSLSMQKNELWRKILNTNVKIQLAASSTFRPVSIAKLLQSVCEFEIFWVVLDFVLRT